jgi:4-amino-4-deoxy-L-arabinose transferase-like glycosyltransferase
MGLALGMRLLALHSFLANRGRYWLFSHPYEMGLVANSLIHGHGYSSPFGGSTGPTAIVAPGYPTLIAAIFLAFGSDTFASALAIIGLQILVSLITIWLMMHIARELFDQRTAIVAGAFWAVSLPLLWIPTIFWETSISACAFVAMVALAIRCRRQPTRAMWILVGASAGIAALINPALLPSLLATMGWVAWETRRVARTAAILGLLTLALVYAPWPIRNAVRFHAFIPMRSTVGLEMYMGNRPGANGRLDESTLPMTNPQELKNFIAMGEIAYTHNRSVEAYAYIRAHPLVFLKLSLTRAWRYWTGTGNVDGSPFYAIHALLTTVLGFAGVVLIYLRRMRAYAVLLALPLLLFPFPYYITHAEFRYRLNIDALLTIPAAYAVTQLAAAWSRRKGAIQAIGVTKPTLAGSTGN